MSVLGTLETSQGLLVDPLTLFLDHLEDCLAIQVNRRFQLLVSAANELVIPRNHAASIDVSSAEQWLSMPCGEMELARNTDAGRPVLNEL